MEASFPRALLAPHLCSDQVKHIFESIQIFWINVALAVMPRDWWGGSRRRNLEAYSQNWRWKQVSPWALLGNGRYALHVNDLRLGGLWDDKGVYLFYLELVTDMFHMLVYLAFFVLICTYYGLPLHIMRGPRAPLSNPADEPSRYHEISDDARQELAAASGTTRTSTSSRSASRNFYIQFLAPSGAQGMQMSVHLFGEKCSRLELPIFFLA